MYLTIMCSADFEEAGHKLLKIKLEPGQEMELCIMLLECCSQGRICLWYYGLLGQRFCLINRIHQENFEKCYALARFVLYLLDRGGYYFVFTYLHKNSIPGVGWAPWFTEPNMQDSFRSIFSRDNSKNTRFFINFFTSIGLGGITENLRAYLKNMPRLIMQQREQVSESEGEYGSSSDSR
ncbi:hypothetical protein C5167_034262 [Papaver somniferum]|uniref:MI domain-containing protein n=1 Tax=Papaver somniferum TaxID=3469 RepID=A0A4Y7KGH4_PAPSO|nr:hypothetical protein C5167_034262 [Papaver somniferum]